MFNITGEMKEGLVGYIEDCDGYVRRLIAPPKPENVSKKTCGYCLYRSKCKKEG